MVPIPSNLPRQLTSFVGRERELSEVRRLLGANRLLTLTGTGGSGKTRLSIELASEVACEFPDGVYFVPLAPLSDPGLVASSIAQNLGLRAASDRALMDRLVSYLRERQILIVLDNYEHLLGGVSLVVDLLKATRAVHFLVTSRCPLRVSGEQEYPVPPLSVPDMQAPPSLLAVAECESVRLFVERASAALPGFAIGGTNFDAINQVVRRLDGLPLAIELAAPRVKSLSPEAILARLDQSLRLLVGGARTRPTVSGPCGPLSPGATSCSVKVASGCWRPVRCSAAGRAWRRSRRYVKPLSAARRWMVSRSWPITACSAEPPANPSSGTRCWRPSGSSRPSDWPSYHGWLRFASAMPPTSWPWPRRRPRN